MAEDQMEQYVSVGDERMLYEARVLKSLIKEALQAFYPTPLRIEHERWGRSTDESFHNLCPYIQREGRWKVKECVPGFTVKTQITVTSKERRLFRGEKIITLTRTNTVLRVRMAMTTDTLQWRIWCHIDDSVIPYDLLRSVIAEFAGQTRPVSAACWIDNTTPDRSAPSCSSDLLDHPWRTEIAQVQSQLRQLRMCEKAPDVETEIAASEKLLQELLASRSRARTHLVVAKAAATRELVMQSLRAESM